MAEILNILVNSFMISALYVMIAVGFTLIFGVGGILNFAHGGVLTAGAFTAYIVSNPNWYGLNPIIGILASVVVGGIIGAVLYLGIVKRIETPLAVGVGTLIIGFLLGAFFRVFITGDTITVSQVVAGSFDIAGQEVQFFQLFVFVLSWAIILTVLWFVTRTRTGTALVATSLSERGAALVGIDSDRINFITWVIASALAALGGVLLMMLQTGGWQMGINPLILSFAIVILGGLGSIKGSIVGAHIIGFTETITITVVAPEYQGMSAFVLLLIFLLVKPEGIYGREAVE